MNRMQWSFGIVALIATVHVGPFASPAQTQSAADLAFRNTVKGPPAGWTGPVFKLSRDYPAAVPSTCPECTWLNVKVDFRPKFPPSSGNPWDSGNWSEYLKRVLAYVKEGQDPQFGNTPGFQINVAGKTRWFNVPWMAYDPTVGREFVHGTTNERTAHLADLIPPQEKKLRTAQTPSAASFLAGMTPSCMEKYPAGFETWAVGYYNEWGGVAFGKAIPKSGQPQTADYLGTQMPAGLPFPQGTVVVKFLTTNAPPDCVPYLKGSPEWQIDRHVLNETTRKYTCTRAVQISRIVQVDVAVTDSRSPTGWVYGTYAYDAGQSGTTFWDHLLPLGIQFGADPWTFPAVPKAESVAGAAERAQPRRQDLRAFRLQQSPRRTGRQFAIVLHVVSRQRLRCTEGRGLQHGRQRAAVVRLQRHVHAIFGGQRRLFRQHHRAAEIRRRHFPRRAAARHIAAARSRLPAIRAVQHLQGADRLHAG